MLISIRQLAAPQPRSNLARNLRDAEIEPDPQPYNPAAYVLAMAAPVRQTGEGAGAVRRMRRAFFGMKPIFNKWLSFALVIRGAAMLCGWWLCIFVHLTGGPEERSWGVPRKNELTEDAES
jgi:hypothetical protein